MREPRKLKKSESLEIRIPYPTKTAFMARCRDEGRSASDALRGFIDGYIEPTAAVAAAASQKPRRLYHIIAAAIATLGVVAVAVPVLARPNLEAEFGALDANADGAVSYAEFAGAASSEVVFYVGPSNLAPRGERFVLPLTTSAKAAAPVDPRIRELLLRTEFDRIDADRNARLSFTEFRRHHDAVARDADAVMKR